MLACPVAKPTKKFGLPDARKITRPPKCDGVAWVDGVVTIVATDRAHIALGRRASMLVVQRPPSAFALPGSVVERAVVEGVREGTRAGVQGAAVTPYLLDFVNRATFGRAREANLALLEQKAALAADITVALAAALNSAVTSE